MALELGQVREDSGTLTDAGLKAALTAVSRDAKGTDVAELIEKDPRAFVDRVLRLTPDQQRGLRAFPDGELRAMTSSIAEIVRKYDSAAIEFVVVRKGPSGSGGAQTSALCSGGSVTSTYDSNPPGGGGPRVTVTATLNF